MSDRLWYLEEEHDFDGGPQECLCCGFEYEMYEGEDGCQACDGNPETCSFKCAIALHFWRGVASRRLDELEFEIDAHFDRFWAVDRHLLRRNIRPFISSEWNFWRCVTLAEKLRADLGREVWLGDKEFAP